LQKRSSPKKKKKRQGKSDTDEGNAVLTSGNRDKEKNPLEEKKKGADQKSPIPSKKSLPTSRPPAAEPEFSKKKRTVFPSKEKHSREGLKKNAPRESARRGNVNQKKKNGGGKKGQKKKGGFPPPPGEGNGARSGDHTLRALLISRGKRGKKRLLPKEEKFSYWGGR